MGHNWLNVPCTGGRHHFLHFLPVAFALARTKSVELFVNDAEDAEAAMSLAARLGEPPPAVTVMRLPQLLEKFVAGRLGARVAKSLRLLWWSRRLRAARGLLTAERTSTVLRRLPGHSPPIIHIPHGAGDRAKGFEPRIALFAAVLVAGEKDRARMIGRGLVDAARCHATGSIKLAALQRLAPMRAPLFANDRPTILYNPHFDPGLSSWDHVWRRLIAEVRGDDRYNLVIAPHVRLLAGCTAGELEDLTAAEVPDRILIDPGSSRSNDMTYTEGADIYIGDASSQVYEFIRRPRPCLFIDAHEASWRDNPDYAMWSFGPVGSPRDNPIVAIDHAVATHGDYRNAQREAAIAALGPDAMDGAAPTGGSDAIDRAAAIIVGLLTDARHPTHR